MFKDLSLSVSVGFLLILGVVILNSVAHTLFPAYFIYIFLALVIFWFFSQIDFEIISYFSVHFYVIAIFLLLLTFFIGKITHNTIRWIPIGSFSLQPSEIVRPLLLVFFANYLTKNKIKFRVDPTNQQTNYFRNKIRLRLLPLLENKYQPGIC